MTTPYLATEPARAEIDALTGPVVVEFGTPTCGYCLAAQAAIVAALQPHPEIRHLKVEDGRGRALGRSFQVKLWPTLVFMKDGVEVAREVRPAGVEPLRRAVAQISAASL